MWLLRILKSTHRQVTIYYSTLKRCKDYKRRISRIDDVNLILVEYTGAYPEIIAPHGNAIHQDSAYVRTNQKVLETIADLTEYVMPRLANKKIFFCMLYYPGTMASQAEPQDLDLLPGLD